ncbi:MAG: Holliday junction resolvase RuvX [Candidatus Goldbacteria bacterium]|nr:Holliday junction resolvase RuvX [Candidatus Goldiibacteriota bacterium]
MVIISFDVGEKKIGVAICDKNQVIASPIKIILNNNNLDAELKAIFKKYAPEKILIGNPVNMDGSKSVGKDFIEKFIKKVENLFPNIPIILWDERLTSKEAEEIMIKSDLSRKKRKNKIDMIAAALILRSYLDNINKK